MHQSWSQMLPDTTIRLGARRGFVSSFFCVWSNRCRSRTGSSITDRKCIKKQVEGI